MRISDIDAFYERKLPKEEFDARVDKAIAELDDEEGLELGAFLAWFQRRYPTALDRLRYATRRYAEIEPTRGAALRRG
jgi:hypothetical protein